MRQARSSDSSRRNSFRGFAFTKEELPAEIPEHILNPPEGLTDLAAERSEAVGEPSRWEIERDQASAARKELPTPPSILKNRKHGLKREEDLLREDAERRVSESSRRSECLSVVRREFLKAGSGRKSFDASKRRSEERVEQSASLARDKGGRGSGAMKQRNNLASDNSQRSRVGHKEVPREFGPRHASSEQNPFANDCFSRLTVDQTEQAEEEDTFGFGPNFGNNLQILHGVKQLDVARMKDQRQADGGEDDCSSVPTPARLFPSPKNLPGFPR